MKSAEELFFFSFLFQAVLCRDFSVTLPESVEALRGLCVLIPCSFEIKDQYDGDLQKNPTGVWLRNGTDFKNNKVFDSKATKENKIEGKIIGDLSMKNCTTVFYNISRKVRGDYYFRVEISGSLKNTYTPAVPVKVRDSPISPSITLYKEDQGKVEDQNKVLEGTSVSLICSAPAPCPSKRPTVTWNFLPEEIRQEQKHSTSFSSSQLNFTATHLHHGLNFTCTATYQLQNKNTSVQNSLTLHVLYAPRFSPSSSCNTTQGLILCSCEVHGNPDPKLEWRVSNQTALLSDTTPIRVESVSNKSLRKSLLFSIPHSVKNTPTLHCVGSSKLGVASQLFFITKAQGRAEGVDVSSVLIGAAVGASVMTLLCAVFLCVRARSNIRDPLSFSTEYASVHYGSEHRPARESAFEEVQEDNTMNMDGVMFQNSAEEGVVYGNITGQTTCEPTQAKLNKDDKYDEIKKYIKKEVQSSRTLEPSEDMAGLYTQVTN